MSGYIGPSPVPQSIQRRQTFTATAAQTTFGTTGYTDGDFIDVYLNGVKLVGGTDYTATNGTDVVLTTGAAAGDILDFVTFNSFQLNAPSFDNSLTLQNATEEDTDGGRESTIIFKGEQSGGEISTLAEIEASHDGTADDEKGDLIFRTNDGADGSAPTERLRIDSAGNVGIGTSSPSEDLTIASTSPQIRFEDTDASGTPYSKVSGVLGNIYIQADDGNEIADSKIDFRVDGVQRAIIDSSGNLLVGKTDTSIATQGVFFGPNYSHITSTNDTPLALSRKSSDGIILDLRKDGTTVGSIGNAGTNFIVEATSSSRTGLNFGGVITPRYNGSDSSSTVDFGSSSLKFKDAHFSGTVNATSFVGDGSSLTGVGGSTTQGAVGTYTWGRPANATDYAPGDTASSLYAVGLSATTYFNTSSGWVGSGSSFRHLQSGTWRSMNGAGSDGSSGYCNLWVRIS